ncbi:PAS domain S-box protein [uncultured Desulfobacter sp.]|uniref:hybrid sensor histidine kinase/response regulator n=1 Tax=uncultured Desulfobacter sp. TaxID=240139 RepID=UPI002AAC21CA|nr:PAS domain S-box protein [uncultured Desulfobacter sp.]
MSQRESYRNLEEKIQALEFENVTLKQDIAKLKDFRNIECIFKTAPIGLAVLIDQKIVRANRCLCEITGYSMAELTGSDTRMFFPDEVSYRDIISQKAHHDVLYGRKSIEAKWRTKDGRMIDVSLTYGLIDEIDFSKGRTVTVQDITTQKRNVAEKEQSQKERELLLAAMEQSPQAIFITNSEGIIEYVNLAFEHQTGYCRPDCIGMDLRMLRSHKHDRQFYINLWAAISSGRMWSGSMVNKKRDGALYTADMTISSVKDENGDITNYVCVQRDISNEIKINEKIARIQKVESLGTLTGGMVHDLNNMLLPILGNTELMLLGRSVHSDATIEMLEQIYESALQAKDLVHQVQSFYRHKKIERHPLQIQNSIDTVLKLMRYGIPSNISIKKVVDPNCPSILGDSTQIHQIILNLVSNGIHAVGKTHGVIKISLMPVHVHDADTNDGVKPGNYICLSVSDTGAGMSTQVMKHIFEPFFTTKGSEKGTGMGLAVVYGAVKEMRGSIRVSSRLGKGSEFRIYFPYHSQKCCTPKIHTLAGNEVTDSEERINVLFVDDEELILKVAKSMLDRLGCHATLMADPLTALAHFEKESTAYDLVITDMYMPPMNGDCLAKHIRAIHRDIPIFFCTGFSNDITLDMMKRIGIKAVLSKPLSIKEISDKIQRILKPAHSVI